MKNVVAILVIVSSMAKAEQLFIVNGKTSTKIEAVKTLMQNPRAKVQKACDVELTDKLTLKCKKIVKNVTNKS